MINNPIKKIKDFKKKGYNVELIIDSSREVFSINVHTQGDVQRFFIPTNVINISELYNAVKGK